MGIYSELHPGVKGMGKLSAETDSEKDTETEVSPDDSDPFASLKLEPNGTAMAKTYLSVKPSSNSESLNLSASEMEEFAALPKSAGQAEVEALLRKILTKRLQSYQQKKGLEGILPYCRGKNKHMDPGKELAKKSELLPLVKQLAPSFYKYMQDYPNSRPEGLDEAFTWVNFAVDDKSNICLVHKMDKKSDDGSTYIFCQRHFYVSRGHNSVQGVGRVFPNENHNEKEHLVLYLSRTSTDQVSGFGGSAKRTMGARIMGGKIADNMQRLRESIEKDKN